MRSSSIIAIGTGFLVAAALAFGPPLAFLALPGAAMFLLLLPLWGIGTTALLFGGFLVTGRFFHAIGVVLFAAIVAVSPLGRFSAGSVHVAKRGIEVDRSVRSQSDVACATGFMPLEKSTLEARPSRIIFDDIGNLPYGCYHWTDVVAVLTGMEVLTVTRAPHYFGASRMMAEMSRTCEGPSGRNRSQVAGPDPMNPLKIDRCIRLRDVSDPSHDWEPAIILKRGPSVGWWCTSLDVVERTRGQETLLGRVHYESRSRRLYPEFPRPSGHRDGTWLHAVLTAVLGEEISEKRLLQHAIAQKRSWWSW